jgi:uncharacterized protein YhhL (DUF1145 family)
MFFLKETFNVRVLYIYILRETIPFTRESRIRLVSGFMLLHVTLQYLFIGGSLQHRDRDFKTKQQLEI